MRTFKYIGIALMAVMLAAGLPAPPKASAQPGVSVSFSVFFNSLSPYGRWSSHPQYGSVWTPAVSADFHPYYTGGRWVMTEYGNTWLSDYEWGWAPFHYGRWFYDDYLGWAWVPDYTWGPGWVNWRTGGGYYGWAPLMPGIQVRLAINLPFNFWVFIPQRHFMSRNWYRYSAPRTQVTNIYHQTTIINNYYNHNNHEYAYGPRSSDIQRHTNSRVDVYNYSSRGNNGGYRESAVRTSTASARKAIEVRERNFDTGPAVANTGSGRSSNPVSPANGRGSSARTSSPVTTPRSTNPVASPATRSSSGSVSSPTTGRTASPASDGARYGTGTTGTGSRESVSTPERSRVSTPPAQRSGVERTAPANAGRSSARESISTGRSSSAPREAVSGSRSSSPSGRTSAPAPTEKSGRSSSGESRGRQ